MNLREQVGFLWEVWREEREEEDVINIISKIKIHKTKKEIEVFILLSILRREILHHGRKPGYRRCSHCVTITDWKEIGSVAIL